MSAKKIQIGTKPTANMKREQADKWVQSRTESTQAKPMKRLTIDVSVDLHRAIKTACAMNGTKMAEEIRQLLIQKYLQT